MNLKPQDVVVALKFVSDHSASGYSEKATALGMSVSEVHGASKRALRAQLLVEQGGRIAPMVRNFTEFLVHGIRYVFPPDSGGLGRGMPTGFEAPPVQHLAGSLIEKEFPRVWADPEGSARGELIEPLYPSVPGEARRDERLYLLLALVDELRVACPRTGAGGLTAAGAPQKLEPHGMRTCRDGDPGLPSSATGPRDRGLPGRPARRAGPRTLPDDRTGRFVIRGVH